MKKYVKIVSIIALASLILLTMSFVIFDRNKISAMKNELRTRRDLYIGVRSDMGGMSIDNDGIYYSNGEDMNFFIGKDGISMARRMPHSRYKGQNWTEGTNNWKHHSGHMGQGGMRHMEGWIDDDNLKLIKQYSYPVDNIKSLKLEGINTSFITDFHEGSDILVEVYSHHKEISVESDLKNKILNLEIYANMHDDIPEKSSIVLIHFPQGVNKDIEVQSSNGQIILGSGKNIDAYTINGDISIYSDSQKIEFESNNGNVDINYKDAEIDGETINGEINISLESPLNAKVKAESVNGYLNILDIKSYQGKELKKTYGNGKNTIDLESVNGNITIR